MKDDDCILALEHIHDLCERVKDSTIFMIQQQYKKASVSMSQREKLKKWQI